MNYGKCREPGLRVIIEHPEMELVGVYANSKEKVGKDGADLCRLEQITGVIATNDMGELLSLNADCVNYNTLIPKVLELERFLESGVNVVGTAMPAVNAIKLVCRAEPGVRRTDELSMTTARGLLF